MTDSNRRTLLAKFSRGIAYTVPALALVAGGSALSGVYADVASDNGYQMMAEAQAESGSQ